MDNETSSFRGDAPPPPFYRPELDGLRFLAFLAVFVHHATFAGPPESESSVYLWLRAAAKAGGYGVDLFFVLSSYLITELLLREVERHGKLDVLSFYARRALRIWPLYFAFLGLAALLPFVLRREQFEARQVVAHALFLGNWACVAWGYPPSVASPLWSVSIEEQFYVAWPLAIRVVGPRRIHVLAGAMLAVSLLVRILLWNWQIAHPGIWCNTFARLDPIALGALLATTMRSRQFHLPGTARVALALGGAISCVVVSRYMPVGDPGFGASVLSYPVVAVAALALVVASVGSREASNGFLAGPRFVYLGRISYGLYVFHSLGVVLAKKLVPRGLGTGQGLAILVLSLAMTIALAALSYRYLERPFLRLKGRFTLVQNRPDEVGA